VTSVVTTSRRILVVSLIEIIHMVVKFQKRSWTSESSDSCDVSYKINRDLFWVLL